MTQEEKLKEAKRLYKTANADQKYVLERLFPELAESEDEKAIKNIIESLKVLISRIEDDAAAPDAKAFLIEEIEKQIAWLEKQCGQRTKLVDFDLNANDSDLQEATYFIPDGFHAEIIGDKVVIKKGEKKPTEWSEEDEEIYRRCICSMRASACGFPEEEKFVEKVDNWLKSLIPQYAWKPSDQQMASIGQAVTNMKNSACYDSELVSLFNDLKKLKG